MRFYPTLSKDDNTTCSDMILRGSPFGPGGSRASISTWMICLVVVLNPFSRECLAAAIRRVLVEEMMFYSGMKLRWSKFFNEDEIEISAGYRLPVNLAMVPVPNHLTMSNLLNMQWTGANRATGPSRTLCPTNGFRLPRLWWAGENHSRAVRNVEGSAPFKNADVANPNSTGY